jgi:hypothetical protein
MPIFCLDESNNVRIFDVKEGNPELVKVSLKNKGYKLINNDQKISFIRSLQSISWTMTPVETLKKLPQEELDDYFEYMYSYHPEDYIKKAVEIAIIN